MKITFLLLLSMLALTRCSDRRHITLSPDKVNGIPKEAFWIGGDDGGTWFMIDSVDNKSQMIIARLYNDQTGDLIVNKTFVLFRDSLNIKWTNLKEQIDGYDGTKILLVDSSKRSNNCYFE